MSTVPIDRHVEVLVVDDEEVVHASIGRILKRAGFASEAVFSADEGLERLRRKHFDLVITDLMMPGKNGIELLRAMRGETIQVPIIMVTGYPTIRPALQAMRLGARDYLSKPFTRRELLSPVMRALRQDPGAERAPGARQEPLKVDELQPGTVLYLPHHAWVKMLQDGTFELGIEASFLDAVGQVTRLSLPEVNELVEQGTIAVTLENSDGEDHGVATPLTGQVLAINEELRQGPARLSGDGWLLRILPSHFNSEAHNLVLREPGEGAS
jgi:CheY-like chemotaxis protein/glycine cleavage system H lipoate-binding protein